MNFRHRIFILLLKNPRKLELCFGYKMFLMDLLGKNRMVIELTLFAKEQYRFMKWKIFVFVLNTKNIVKGLAAIFYWTKPCPGLSNCNLYVNCNRYPFYKNNICLLLQWLMRFKKSERLHPAERDDVLKGFCIHVHCRCINYNG